MPSSYNMSKREPATPEWNKLDKRNMELYCESSDGGFRRSEAF